MRLKVIFVPLRQFPDGSMGFLVADLSDDGEDGAADGDVSADRAAGAPQQRAIVAFADPNDADSVRWLWESWRSQEPGFLTCALLPSLKPVLGCLFWRVCQCVRRSRSLSCSHRCKLPGAESLHLLHCSFWKADDMQLLSYYSMPSSILQMPKELCLDPFKLV